MLTVHHLENSRSQRVLWLLEEIGVDYAIERYERDVKTSLAPPALKKVHPLGKSPVLDDDGLVVAETGVIVEYLIDKYGGGRFRPQNDPRARLDYVYWLHFAEATMMPQMLLHLFFNRIKSAPMPFFVKPIARRIGDEVLKAYVAPNLADQFAFIERHLGERDWFAGDELSGADVMMSFPLEGARANGALPAGCERIAAFVERVQARPAYRRALEKGGPYAYAS